MNIYNNKYYYKYMHDLEKIYSLKKLFIKMHIQSEKLFARCST